MRKHERERLAGGIEETLGQGLLRRDVAVAERAVMRLIEMPLTEGQCNALVSFTFNLGAGAVQHSMSGHKLNGEEHGVVPADGS